jgi:hypothetical protein
MLARMAGQNPRRPNFVRIAVLLGLVARQRHQPGFGLRRDHRFLARPRSVVEGRQRARGDRPLDTALDRLMMDAEAPPDRTERRRLPVGEQHSRPFDPARRLGPRARKRRQGSDFLLAHRQLDRSPPCRHLAAPRSAHRRRGIREQPTGSINARFMESVV